MEPKIPSPSFEFAAVKALISHGFPKEKIVIRVDPVIPTNKGLAVAYRRVLRTGMKAGFSRYRISVRDNNRKQTYNGLLFLCIKSYTRSHGLRQLCTRTPVCGSVVCRHLVWNNRVITKKKTLSGLLELQMSLYPTKQHILICFAICNTNKHICQFARL